MRLRICWSAACLRSHLEGGYLIPDLTSVCAFRSVGRRFQSMPPRTDVLTNRPERSQEVLRLAGRLEAAHRPLPLPSRLMRILCPIVQTLMAAVRDTGQDLRVGCLGAPTDRKS